MAKNIEVKFEPSLDALICLNNEKIRLSEVTSIKEIRAEVFEKKFLKKKIIDISFTGINALERNQEKLTYLKALTNSVSEITSSNERHKNERNIYRLGFPRKYDFQINF